MRVLKFHSAEAREAEIFRNFSAAAGGCGYRSIKYHRCAGRSACVATVERRCAPFEAENRY